MGYDVNQLKDMTPDMQNPMANYAYYERTFGDLKTATERLSLGFQPASLPGGFQTQDYDTKCYLNI